MFEVRLHGEAAFLCALVDDASIIQVCGSVRPRLCDATSEDAGSFREVGESMEGWVEFFCPIAWKGVGIGIGFVVVGGAAFGNNIDRVAGDDINQFADATYNFAGVVHSNEEERSADHAQCDGEQHNGAPKASSAAAFASGGRVLRVCICVFHDFILPF